MLGRTMSQHMSTVLGNSSDWWAGRREGQQRHFILPEGSTLSNQPDESVSHQRHDLHQETNKLHQRHDLQQETNKQQLLGHEHHHRYLFVLELHGLDVRRGPALLG